ncbi:Holliday junction resolvase RuvX [Demetria terragena]|uniref:Holliday junction resolvase RuvX n=1 Tax=Demetria terragena TaxID=63959 RepID=UPI000475C3BE|nr:Holliday junction resolvase RuvX [Demetria terragena]
MRRGIRLGVDVGQARVGLAASDPDGILATPVETVARDRDGRKDIRHIAQIARDRDAIEILVGLPIGLSGREGEAADGARAWARELKKELASTGVRLVDERLTTVDAHRSLRDSGLRMHEHRAHIDQQAAVLILQVALDSERLTGQPAGELVGGRKPRTKRSAHPKGEE